MAPGQNRTDRITNSLQQAIKPDVIDQLSHYFSKNYERKDKLMKMKKLLVVVLSLLMVLSTGVLTAFAAEGDAGTITITPPTGVDAEATNTYKVYKVFDATVNADDPEKVSYKLCAGDTLTPAMIAAGFSVDAAGNVSGPATLDATAIDAIAAYVTETDLVATLTATGTAKVTTDVLGFGYYYITTSTGTVVTIDSNNNAPTVNDKNTVPSVDKKITGATSIDEDGKKALAQVGTTVEYSATVTVGDGAIGYIFHDTMETGLTYNSDVKVYIDDDEVAAANYEIDKDGDKLQADTFSISFKDDYIKTLAVGTKLIVTYSATVTEDAITTDPLNNTCYISYGDKNSSNKTPGSGADVYAAKITVTKKDGDGNPLPNAGFVLKNAAGKYYKIDNNVVSWVDNIAEATEYTSDAQGAVAPFKGLANGTYTLVEKTVPAGYNKAEDQTITIAEHDYTAENLEQAANVVNNAGTELPSTGGMGTTILYIIGAALVVGCGIMLIAKKRTSNK